MGKSSKKIYGKPRQHTKKQRHHFANKDPNSQSYSFSSSHVRMWELVHKNGWARKKLMLSNCSAREDSSESFGQHRDQTINPKGFTGIFQWIFTGRTYAEAEAPAPIFWPPDVKCQLIGKDPDSGKDWWQEEKGVTEDEIVGGHHRLNWHEFEHVLRDSEGQGSLACCSPWGCKELGMT